MIGVKTNALIRDCYHWSTTMYFKLSLTQTKEKVLTAHLKTSSQWHCFYPSQYKATKVNYLDNKSYKLRILAASAKHLSSGLTAMTPSIHDFIITNVKNPVMLNCIRWYKCESLCVCLFFISLRSNCWTNFDTIY